VGATVRVLTDLAETARLTMKRATETLENGACCRGLELDWLRSGINPAPPMAPDHENGDRSRCHTGNARCLAQRTRSHRREALSDLGGEPGDRPIVQVVRDQSRLRLAKSLDVLQHARDVAFVLDGDLDLSAHESVGRGGVGEQPADVRVAQLRAPEQLKEGR